MYRLTLCYDTNTGWLLWAIAPSVVPELDDVTEGIELKHFTGIRAKYLSGTIGQRNPVPGLVIINKSCHYIENFDISLASSQM